MTSILKYNAKITLIIIAIVSAFTYLEYYGYQPSKEIFNGTIIGKKITKGAKNHINHEMRIQWNTGSQSTLYFSEKGYHRAKIGWTVERKLNYIPILGSAGYAYVPEEAKGGVFQNTGLMMLKLFLIILFVIFIRKYKKAN